MWCQTAIVLHYKSVCSCFMLHAHLQPNRPLYSPTDTQYKHTSTRPQNTQPATGDSVLDKQSVSGDLSIGDLCDDRSTVTAQPFPLLTVKPYIMEGEQVTIYHPQPETMKSTCTALKTSLPLLHVKQDTYRHTCTSLKICSSQTTDVDKGTNDEGGPMARPHGLQVNMVPLSLPQPDVVGKEGDTLHPLPLIPQSGAANTPCSKGLPLLQCQPLGTDMEPVELDNSCQRGNVPSCSTVQVPSDLPHLLATPDRRLSGPVSHPPLLFLPQERLSANPILPPSPTLIDLPKVHIPAESCCVKLFPDDTVQNALRKPMELLQIEDHVSPGGAKLLQLPSQPRISATEDRECTATEEPQPRSNISAGEARNTSRHKRCV